MSCQQSLNWKSYQDIRQPLPSMQAVNHEASANHESGSGHSDKDGDNLETTETEISSYNESFVEETIMQRSERSTKRGMPLR